MVICNGMSLFVSSNLDEALRYIRKRRLRSSSPHHTIWVDAVCINQDDNIERGHQVQQMKEIYNSAEHVLMWLGGPLVELCAYQFLKTKEDQPHLGKALAEYNMGMWEIEKDSEWFRTKITREDRPEKVLEFVDIFDQPWFHRIWVIQEVVMARRVKVLCGSTTLTWENLLEAAELVDTYLRISDDRWNTRVSCKFLLRLEIMRKRLEVTKSPVAPQSSLANAPQDLFELVLGNSTQQATDPRDKIYALLGIAMELDSDSLAVRVEPDYSLPPETVFLNFSKMILDGTRPLRLLKAIDWRAFSDLGMSKYCLDPQYEAIIHKQADLHILNIAGKNFDVVSAVSQTLRPEEVTSTTTVSSAIQEWLSLAQQDRADILLLKETYRAQLDGKISAGQFQTMVSLATEARNAIPYETFAANNQIPFYRELRDSSGLPGFWDLDRFNQVGRLAYDARSRSDSEMAFWNTLLARPTQSLQSPPWHLFYPPGNRRFKEVCVGRKFIVTREGHYGIAPPDTRAGDHRFRSLMHPNRAEMNDDPVHRDAGDNRIPLLDYPYSGEEAATGDLGYRNDAPYEPHYLHDGLRPSAVPNPEATSASTLLSTRGPAEKVDGRVAAEENALASMFISHEPKSRERNCK
ncbi:hypothetical protein SLS54_009621 [Diplodia seriata]